MAQSKLILSRDQLLSDDMQLKVDLPQERFAGVRW